MKRTETAVPATSAPQADGRPAGSYTRPEAPETPYLDGPDAGRVIIKEEEEKTMNATNTTPAGILTPEELENLFRELRKFDRIREDAEAEAEAIKDRIKAHMNAANVEDLTGTEYRATWHTVNGTTFDKKAAEAIHPGIIASCTRPNQYKKFLYK